MEYKCKKCGGETFETREKGPHIGLYCSNCYTWQKWLNKAQVIIVRKKIGKVFINGKETQESED